MPNFRLLVQYDGTEYNGWQIQPRGRTIQGELTRVISLLNHRPVTVHGAGRTDSGVHAEGQVASVVLDRDFETRVLRDATNANLDPDLRVREIIRADDSFNARFAAISKTYRYRIWTGEVVSPFSYRFVHQCRAPLEIGEMARAASFLLGTYDFSAFSSGESDARDRVRTVKQIEVLEEGEVVSIIASANGFLRYMVRTIVGTLIEIGRGRMQADAIADVLISRNRKRAGPTAPAAGLTLLRVDY